MRNILLILCLFTTGLFAQTTEKTTEKVVENFSKTSKDIVKTTSNIADKTVNGIDRVYTDGTKVVEKAYEVVETIAPKIEEALKSIGSSLKMSANQVWDILVRQQLVWSICYLIVTILALFSWGHFLWRFKVGSTQPIQEEPNKGEWKDSNVAMVVITCIIAVSLSITSYLHFEKMLTGFINPEYGALKTIAEVAAQIK